MNDQFPSSEGQENLESQNQVNQPVSPTGVNPEPIMQYTQAPNQAQQFPAPISEKNEPWRTVVTILALVFMPLIGIILTWVITNWSKTVKICVTVVAAVLIPIIIIGILASTVLVGMSSARGKARDVSAKTNVRTISNSLEIYYEDNTVVGADGIPKGTYPISNSYKTMTTELLNFKSITSLPKDTEGYPYKYLYCSTDGSAYNLQVVLESTGQPFKSNSSDGTDTCTPGE